MALKSHFASLSLSASVDQQTGNLSVFDLVEEIRVGQLPVQIQSLVICLVLEKSREETVRGQVQIHLRTPDGNSHQVGHGPLEVPRERRRVKAVFRFGSFPLSQFGDHRFLVSWASGSTDDERGSVELPFDVVQAPQVAQGLPPKQKPPVSH